MAFKNDFFDSYIALKTAEASSVARTTHKAEFELC